MPIVGLLAVCVDVSSNDEDLVDVWIGDECGDGEWGTLLKALEVGNFGVEKGSRKPQPGSFHLLLIFISTPSLSI